MSQVPPRERSPGRAVQPAKPRRPWYSKGAFLGGLGGLCVVVAAFVPLLVPPSPAKSAAQKDTALSTEPDSPPTKQPAEPERPKPKAVEPLAAVGSTSSPPLAPRGEALPKLPADLEHPIVLQVGKTTRIAALGTVIALQFRETLGHRYIELVISPPDGPSRRIPARSAGSTGTFAVGGLRYEVQVLTLDGATQTAEIMIRPLSTH